MVVTGALRLAPSAVPRDSLCLALWSEMTDVRFEVVEPREAAPASVTTDSASGDRTWIVRSARAMPAGTPVTIHFSYTTDSTASAPQFRISPSGSYAGGGGEIWYPRRAFDSLSVGTLRFHVRPGQDVVAPGMLVSTEAEQAEGHFTFEVDQPAHFSFAAADYTIRQHSGTPSVSLYLLRSTSDADRLLDRIASTLDELTDLFGPLPYPRYGVAEVDFGGSVGGTSEYGFFLVDDSFVERGLPLPFVAHEIGHAWWGNRVGTAPGVGRMMLTEGLASLGMVRAIEHVEGLRAAEAYRASEYPGYETSGSPEEFFRLAAAGLDLPITGLVPQGQRQILAMHRTVNSKGWFVLDMLARHIGEQSFNKILTASVRMYGGRRLTWTTFQETIATEAREDLTWFFEQWLERTGAPDFRMEWAQRGDTLVGEIVQAPPAYRASLEVELTGNDGEVMLRTVEVEGERTPLHWTIPYRVRRAELDPRHLVLRWTPQRRARAEALAAYTRADFERRFGSSTEAIELFRSALERLPAPDTVGVEFRLEYGLAQTLVNAGEHAGGAEHAKAAVAAPVRPSELLPWAYVVLARAARAMNDEALVRRAVAPAVTADAGLGASTGAREAALQLLE